MKRVILIGLVGLLITGCMTFNSNGQEKYNIFKPMKEPITLHIMSKEEINERWGGRDIVHGFALWTEHGAKRNCRIFIPPLNDAEAIETLLHEIRHCQEGDFHR